MAIKVLADNWGHDDSVRQRFLEEGRFLRRVESEHVSRSAAACRPCTGAACCTGT